MNILHISNTDINFDSRILKEIKSLASHYHIKILGIGIKSRNNKKAQLKFQNTGIESVKIYSNHWRFLPRELKLIASFIELWVKILLKTRKLKIDVVHCHDTLALPIGFCLKKLKKSKLIYDAHELESNKNGQSKFMSWGTLLIEKKCWESIDLFISVSPSILDWYKTHLGKKKNVLILNAPEVVNTTEFKKGNGKYFHKKFGIQSDSRIFLYLGFLTKGRSIDKIIHAFNDNAIQAHVVFVGYGDLKSKILTASKKNDKIHYHEAVKHNQVVHLSRNADVGLCLIENISLSDYYCLPNKLFEYAFSGLPVLASDFPELKNIIKKYKLGYCCALDVKAIKTAIKVIEKSPIPKINTDLKALSWEHQEQKLVAAYDNLLN